MLGRVIKFLIHTLIVLNLNSEKVGDYEYDAYIKLITLYKII